MSLQIANKYYISSSSKRSTDSNSNFKVSARDDAAGTQKFSIEYVKLTKSWYSVNSTNNVFDFNDGVNTLQVIIPEGNYTATQFISALNALILLAVPLTNAITFTIQTTANAGKVSVTIANGATMTLLFADNSTTNSIRNLIGFQAHLDIVSTGPVLSDSLLDLNDGVTAIDVTSQRLMKFTTQSAVAGPGVGDLVIRVPVNNVSFGETLIYRPLILRMFDYRPSSIIGQIDIKLLLPNGLVVDLHGTEFEISLIMYS